MLISLKSFDAYNRNARVYPALIGVAPAIAALALLVTWTTLSVSTSVASVGLVAIFFAMGDLARRLGKALEPRLYSKQEGMPSIRLLRRSDPTFDEPSKERYRAFLSEKLRRPVPTAAEEAQDQAAADRFYEASSTWLRENTRDKRKFDILFNELVAYGFRRTCSG